MHKLTFGEKQGHNKLETFSYNEENNQNINNMSLYLVKPFIFFYGVNVLSYYLCIYIIIICILYSLQDVIRSDQIRAFWLNNNIAVHGSRYIEASAQIIKVAIHVS